VSIDPTNGCRVDGETIAWWYMSCGRVLGVYDGRLIEYEPSTLAPLGLVVGPDELAGKRVVVQPSGIPEDCKIDSKTVAGMEGADCAENEAEEQAVLLVDDETGAITVVQPNEDGSYWRKIVRNKMIRMKEKRRLQAAQSYAEETFKGKELDGKVVSSWGPYTSIVGTATKTGVAGLTAKAVDALAPKTSKSEDWGATGDELAAAFGAIDKDSSGTISASELATAIRAASPGVTDAEVEELVSVAGLDAEGEIALPDFVMLMLFKKPKLNSVAQPA